MQDDSKRGRVCPSAIGLHAKDAAANSLRNKDRFLGKKLHTKMPRSLAGNTTTLTWFGLPKDNQDSTDPAPRWSMQRNPIFERRGKVGQPGLRYPPQICAKVLILKCLSPKST